MKICEKHDKNFNLAIHLFKLSFWNNSSTLFLGFFSSGNVKLQKVAKIEFQASADHGKIEQYCQFLEAEARDAYILLTNMLYTG